MKYRQAGEQIEGEGLIERFPLRNLRNNITVQAPQRQTIMKMPRRADTGLTTASSLVAGGNTNRRARAGTPGGRPCGALAQSRTMRCSSTVHRAKVSN